MERVPAASFGLILSATIIKIFKFNPISLVIFTAIFMPLCIRFNLMQVFFTNIVLATHFLLDENVSLIFVLDQYLLLLVGVLCTIISNLYMPSQNNEIISQLEKIDENNLNIENKATYFLLIENIKELIILRIKNIF